MAKKLALLTLKAEAGAIPISEVDSRAYLAPVIADHRGELVTIGAWSVPVRFTAPAVSMTFNPMG